MTSNEGEFMGLFGKGKNKDPFGDVCDVRNKISITTPNGTTIKTDIDNQLIDWLKGI
jgi:hypothetical protein